MTIELLKKRIIRYKLYLSQTGYYKNKKQNMWLSYKKIVPPCSKQGCTTLQEPMCILRNISKNGSEHGLAVETGTCFRHASRHIAMASELRFREEFQ